MKQVLRAILTATLGACAFNSPLPAQNFTLAQQGLPLISLDGDWHFHPGDDPSWANPNLDDSTWPLIHSTQDWASQGYKQVTGFAWYRFRLTFPANISDLSISLPRINDSWEIYANGQLIGTVGRLSPSPIPYDRSGRGGTFRIPAPATPPSGPSRIVSIAIRVWHWDALNLQIGGGPEHGGGLAGASAQVNQQATSALYSSVFHFSPGIIVILLESIAAFGSFFLYFQRRQEKEFLWFAILMASRAAYEFAVTWQNLAPINSFFINPLRITLTFGTFQLAEVFFYLHFFRAPRTRTFRFVVASLFLIFPVALWFAGFQTQFGIIACHVIILIVSIPYYIWVLNIVWKNACNHHLDARILLLPAILQKVAQIWNRFTGITYVWGLQSRFDYLTQLITEPVRIDLLQLVNTIFLFCLFLIMIRRFTLTRSAEERFASEVNAARNVQQFLIPDHLPLTPNLRIESQYLPATEVGGDFFQVLPHPSDGSVLVVIGDVAGHGLDSGMLATLLVGAIRTAAVFTTDPAAILAILNDRLHGRGLATCLALRIESTGLTSIASAGHIPPYLNGTELPIEAAFPLGVLPGITFPTTSLTLSPDTQLTLLTDGVPEAQRPAAQSPTASPSQNQLFGFDRTAQISTQSAQSIAQTAQSWGQTDDITVLTLTRTT